MEETESIKESKKELIVALPPDRSIQILQAQVTLNELCERIGIAKQKNPSDQQRKEDFKNVIQLKFQFEHLVKMREENMSRISELEAKLAETLIRLNQAEKMNRYAMDGMSPSKQD